MPPIEMDRRQWPLVNIRFPSEPLADADLVAYLAALAALADVGEPYATLSDLRPMTSALTERQCWIFDDWMQRNEAAMAPVAAANAVVAASPLTHTIATTAYWHWREPPRFRIFDDPAIARRWCQDRLRRRIGERAQRGAAAEAPGAPLATTAALIDLFHEPAFLVEDDGAVGFANRAARRAYPPPHDWVAALVSRRAGASRLPVRIARVELDGRPVSLIILGEGAALAALPPSLFRIAQRVCRGETDKEIAAHTGLSLPTVRTYVSRLFVRAGVHDRRTLMRRWYGSSDPR